MTLEATHAIKGMNAANPHPGGTKWNPTWMYSGLSQCRMHIHSHNLDPGAERVESAFGWI